MCCFRAQKQIRATVLFDQDQQLAKKIKKCYNVLYIGRFFLGRIGCREEAARGGAILERIGAAERDWKAVSSCVCVCYLKESV